MKRAGCARAAISIGRGWRTRRSGKATRSRYISPLRAPPNLLKAMNFYHTRGVLRGYLQNKAAHGSKRFSTRDKAASERARRRMVDADRSSRARVMNFYRPGLSRHPFYPFHGGSCGGGRFIGARGTLIGESLAAIRRLPRPMDFYET